MPPERTEDICYTPQQVSKRLGLSADVVRAKFRRLPGVLVIGEGRRKTIRIPVEVLEQWVEAHKVRER